MGTQDRVQALRNDGVLPPAVDNPAAYRVRSGGVILPRDADWLKATAEYRDQNKLLITQN